MLHNNLNMASSKSASEYKMNEGKLKCDNFTYISDNQGNNDRFQLTKGVGHQQIAKGHNHMSQFDMLRCVQLHDFVAELVVWAVM